ACGRNHRLLIPVPPAPAGSAAPPDDVVPGGSRFSPYWEGGEGARIWQRRLRSRAMAGRHGGGAGLSGEWQPPRATWDRGGWMVRGYGDRLDPAPGEHADRPGEDE